MGVNINEIIKERRRLLSYRETEEVEVTPIYEVKGRMRQELSGRFGQQPEEGKNIQCALPIKEIRTLTEQEKCIFSGQDFVSPNYCIQFLYKVIGHLARDIFRENVHRIFRQIPDLRVNFLQLGIDRKRYKVVFEDRCPEVIYSSLNCLAGETLDRALQRAMAIDRRKGFDVESDVLMRITIINTERKNEYAILLTESRLIAHAWKADEFLSMAWYGMEGSGIPEPRELSEFSSAAYRHWDSVLDNLPMAPTLPGYKGYDMRYEGKLYQVRLKDVDRKLLLGRARGSMEMMMTILHTAWGLIQRHVQNTRETSYCLILHDRALQLKNAADMADIVRPVPMRISCEDGDALRDIVGRQFRKMLVSQSMPVSYMKDILADTGQTTDVFPFLLHFHSFLEGKKGFSEVDTAEDGDIVDMYSWDAAGENFAIYFDMVGQEISYTIAYNTYCFAPINAEAMARAYEITLHYILCLWDKDFAYFNVNLKDALRKWDRTYSFYVN